MCGDANTVRGCSMKIFSVSSCLRAFRRDERGTVAIIMGFMMIPLVGAIGIGFEVSNWYLRTRAMQNAADAAVIAAAINGGATYDKEADAVAAGYGFVNGVNNVTIASSNSAACPSGGNNCYSVSISAEVPLYLSQIVGFAGNAKINGAAAVKLAGSAVAGPGTTQVPLCLWALGSPGIQTNGAPKANMQCNVASNSNATCHGHNLGAPIGIAVGTNNGCGVTQISNVQKPVDPFASLASNGNIPPHNCPAAGNVPNQWASQPATASPWIVCGDLKLTKDVTIDAPAGAVLVIVDGNLDTANFTLQTQTNNNSGLTIIFTGTKFGAPTGSGTLDFAAPTSGVWAGVAIYQDPNLPSGVISAAGNSPNWAITGLVYLPKASVTFSGAVGKFTNGQKCFVLVVNDITINGTGSILPNFGGCASAGLKLPTATVPGGRPSLQS
jgi:Putative Flp pilus-assembly TadE/G-like